MNKRTKRKGVTGPKTLRSSFSDLKINDDPMSRMIYGTTDSWYDAKHPVQDVDEKKMINSIGIKRCPYCHGTHFRKKGFDRNGIQRYICLEPGCGKSFNPLTRTVFDSHKIPISQWIEFLVHLFQMQSIMDSSIDNTNSNSTGRYWTFKVFDALKDYQDGIMMGEVFYTDETYLPVTPSDLFLRYGEKLRGLSRNVHCIFTATDGEKTILIATGFGKPSFDKVRAALMPHVKRGSVMIDDGERSHSLLVKELGVRRIVHPTSETKGLSDSKTPMNPINTVHRMFKRFMRSHGGYKRTRIQDWCNLFAFLWNHHGNIPEMVEDILVRMLNTHDLMRYRKVMKKN